MKKTLLLTALLAVFQLVNAQPPKGDAKAGSNYGKAVSETGSIEVDMLSNLLTNKSEATAKVYAVVTDVCQKEGCWIKVQTAQGKMMVKMKDHSFLVPTALQGKTIVIDGTAKIKETSVEELRHYAEDAGKSKQEIADIKEPKKEVVFTAEGILVKN